MCVILKKNTQNVMMKTWVSALTLCFSRNESLRNETPSEIVLLQTGFSRIAPPRPALWNNTQEEAVIPTQQAVQRTHVLPYQITTGARNNSLKYDAERSCAAALWKARGRRASASVTRFIGFSVGFSRDRGALRGRRQSSGWWLGFFPKKKAARDL